MTSQDKLDLFSSLLLTGNATPERQIGMGNDLVEVCIEFRKMRRALDEIYQNEREQDEIDRRTQAEADRMARIKAAGNVEMFPTLLRRPMPSVPPIQAIEQETWR